MKDIFLKYYDLSTKGLATISQIKLVESYDDALAFVIDFKKNDPDYDNWYHDGHLKCFLKAVEFHLRPSMMCHPLSGRLINS